MGDQVNSGAQYQQLVGLQDIKGMKDLNEDAMRDILRASTGNQGLSIDTMGQIEDMSGTNDAFNSSICSLEVVANLSEKGNGVGNKKTFYFVIKATPKLSFVKYLHKLSKPFLNEVTWYLDMMVQMNHLESIVNLPGNPLSTHCPIVYHAYSNYYSGESINSCNSCPWFCWLPFRASESGILVMENVKKRGYVMFDKMRILPLDHMLLTMNDLAHFHGRWLVYRWLGQEGRLGDQGWSLETFKASIDTQKRIPKLIYKQLINGTHKTVSKILQLEGKEDYLDRVDKFFNVSVRRQLDHFMGNVSSPIDTCCHGDFWSNNIMFKYDEDDKVEKTIMVDFQLINFGHPAYDVLYMLFISTDLEFREQHMEQCLHTYWNILNTDYLEKYKPKDVVYDEAAFKADIKVYKSIAFVLACTLLPNVLSGSQVEVDGILALRDIQRKQSAELEDPNNVNSREIKRRVVGLVTEMVKDGLI